MKGKKVQVNSALDALSPGRDLVLLVLAHSALRQQVQVLRVLGFLSFRIQLEFLGVSEISVASLKNGKRRSPCSYNYSTL